VHVVANLQVIHQFESGGFCVFFPRESANLFRDAFVCHRMPTDFDRITPRTIPLIGTHFE
jgi:hypothetical protein